MTKGRMRNAGNRSQKFEGRRQLTNGRSRNQKDSYQGRRQITKDRRQKANGRLLLTKAEVKM